MGKYAAMTALGTFIILNPKKGTSLIATRSGRQSFWRRLIMANYQRPSFIKKGVGFSILYVTDTRKFLITKGGFKNLFKINYI